MNLETGRLLETLQATLAQLVNRYGVPGSDMDLLAARVAIGELLRQADSSAARRLYEEGRDLAVRLTPSVQQVDSSNSGLLQLRELPKSIHEAEDYASCRSWLEAIKKALALLVADLTPDASAELSDILYAVSEWEARLLRAPHPAREPDAPENDVHKMLERSARAQGGQFGEAQISDVQTLLGGFANNTTLFQLKDGNGQAWDLVARADTGLQLGIEGRDISGEFHLLRFLHRHGITVAEPLWLEENTRTYGTKFLVTRKVGGRNFGTVVEAQKLSAIQIQALANELAQIHGLPLDPADPDLRVSHIDTRLLGGSTSEAMNDYLERWIRLWLSTGLENSPTIIATMNWLRANLPQIDDSPTLVHGDYAMHNIMMQDERISGVLDWEMAHLGSRAEDIAGLLASFPEADNAEEFMRHYVAAGGKAPTGFELRYCDVFRHFGMYVVMLESQMRFKMNSELHPELLVLGSFVATPADRMPKLIADAECAKAQ